MEIAYFITFCIGILAVIILFGAFVLDNLHAKFIKVDYNNLENRYNKIKDENKILYALIMNRGVNLPDDMNPYERVSYSELERVTGYISDFIKEREKKDKIKP